MVSALDYPGSGDFIAWDSEQGGYWLVGHDPAGIHPWHRNFDYCIRDECIGLSVGYYG